MTELFLRIVLIAFSSLQFRRGCQGVDRSRLDLKVAGKDDFHVVPFFSWNLIWDDVEVVPTNFYCAARDRRGAGFRTWSKRGREVGVSAWAALAKQSRSTSGTHF